MLAIFSVFTMFMDNMFESVYFGVFENKHTILIIKAIITTNAYVSNHI